MKLRTKKTFITLFFFLCVSVHTVSSDSLIVGYYPYWKYSVLPAESIKYTMLTHIIHAFIWPESDGTLHIDDNIRNTSLIESAHDDSIKVLISVGGEGHTDNFQPIIADTVLRKQFVNDLLDFCLESGYDGIDIDMELLSTSSQRNLATILIRTLRDSIQTQDLNLLLTMAIPPTNYWAQWYDLESLKIYIDWFNVMTYNFFWSTVPVAVHNAPLYSSVQSQFDYGSIHSAFNYLHSDRGVPKEKIVLGIPFFGHGCYASDLFESNTGYTGSYDYNEIAPLISKEWNYFWDNMCKVPYLLNHDHTEFITFDDTLSVRLKCEYTDSNNAAGVMIWDLSKDVMNNNQPLLETIAKSMGREIQVIISEKTKYPDEFIILRNFPNPFNNNTIITYYMPFSSRIKLEIFSILGQKIATLSDVSRKRGWHKYLLNAGSYTSGEYILRLTTPQNSVSKKIIILK